MNSLPLKELAVQVPIDHFALEGDLVLPAQAQAVILFAHGSGSSRHSPRNRFVAHQLQAQGLATLLLDLLTLSEEQEDLVTRRLRFDISLLATRLMGAIEWLKQHPETQGLKIGLFGASTGAAAALIAAAKRPDAIYAVVSRGGRPDLAIPFLPQVQAPTLLLVGGEDLEVIDLNQEAYRYLKGEKSLVIIPGATHLFEEPGTLEAIAEKAAQWFLHPEAPIDALPSLEGREPS